MAVSSPHRTYSPELSRAGATAIRLALTRGERWDAFHIWHSTRWSMHRYSDNQLASAFQKPTSKFEPIDFHQAVAPRLGGHCLLHGLLRAGERRLAGKVAERMVADGVRIHSRTLDTILQTLRPPQIAETPSSTIPAHPPSLSHYTARHPDVQCAITLLHGAYRHRWQRTHAMYEKTISICLLQAEVLVASLLLILLLQDYQLHASHARPTSEGTSEVLECTNLAPPKPKRGTLGYWSQSLTLAILRTLRPHIERGRDDPLFQESSEALAILANALDSRSLPPYRIAPLLQLLYSYPKCKTRVWSTGEDGSHRRVPARDYFRSVLIRFIDSLPTEAPDRMSSEDWLRGYYGGKRGMDITSYNALIRYALFEQRSLAMAQRVVDSMLEARVPPLRPNRETYTIALRGCTLLRRNDLVERILVAMTDRSNVSADIQHTVAIHSNPPQPSSSQSRTKEAHTTEQPIQRANAEDLILPNALQSPRLSQRLLVAYIVHLTKTGQADKICELIFRLIPEFRRLRSSSRQSFSRNDQETRRTPNMQALISRVTSLGPVVLSALISGLRSGGRTGLAERLWELMKTVECASWKTPNPWMIPVHAYTSMIQVYVAEARRSRRTTNSPYCISLDTPSKDLARGFGRLNTLSKDAQESVRAANGKRWVVGREMCMQVYRHLLQAEERVENALRDGSIDASLRCRLAISKPDARFFKAALRLIGHRDGIRRRRRSPNSSYWRQKLRWAWGRFERTGATSPLYTANILTIARDMSTRGFEVPPEYQLILVGYMGRWMTRLHEMRRLKRAATADPYPQREEYSGDPLSQL